MASGGCDDVDDGEVGGDREDYEGGDTTNDYGDYDGGGSSGGDGGSGGGGDGRDGDGGSLGHTTKYSVGGWRKGDTRHGKPRVATIPASGRNDEEAVEELHTRK